jgi:hypothetical protein
MMDLKNVPESFFHFLWKFRLLKPGLTTYQGQSLQILHPGIHNQDAGPDFQCARIRLDNTAWAGNVEIHLRASDWYRHGHQRDESYRNVILHVVAERDCMVKDLNGHEMNTLCIDGCFDPELIMRYREIIGNLLWIPCMNLLKKSLPLIQLSMVNSMGIDRLKEKTAVVTETFASCNNDWEECCYRLISKQFGARINTMPFEMLARSLPVKLLKKYHHESLQAEALLFGQSGLLKRRLRGEYPRKLKKEHAYLAQKHSLAPMPGYLWNFLRLRPAGFPTLRIALLAALYTKYQSVFQEIITAASIQELSGIFSLTASAYWDEHYVFDKKSKPLKKKFGELGIQLLLINAIIPLIYAYGMQSGQNVFLNRAVGFLESLPPENNAITRRWQQAGIKASNSLESQGLLQLKKVMCDQKRCLDCSIGYQILKQP